MMEKRVGGGKIVNKITFKNLSGKKQLEAEYSCDYIPTSPVQIYFYGASGVQTGATFVSPSKYSGSAIMGVTPEKPFTAQWQPQEDDTYIYEVVIEQ